MLHSHCFMLRDAFDSCLKAQICARRYCDYLHGTVAMSAPLFLNVQPQPGSATPPGKGKLPSLPAKAAKQAGKKSNTKGRSSTSAKSHAPTLTPDSPHFKYTIQEVLAISSVVAVTLHKYQVACLCAYCAFCKDTDSCCDVVLQSVHPDRQDTA